jgi:hypothetical protein
MADVLGPLGFRRVVGCLLFRVTHGGGAVVQAVRNVYVTV